MASRKLGGGRILGSGRGLAPPPEHGQSPRRVRSSSPLAPSDASSPSRGSQIAAGLSPPSTPSTVPGVGEDLTSNISLAAPALHNDGQLVCPICGEEMVRTRASGILHFCSVFLVGLAINIPPPGHIAPAKQVYRRTPSVHSHRTDRVSLTRAQAYRRCAPGASRDTAG